MASQFNRQSNRYPRLARRAGRQARNATRPERQSTRRSIRIAQRDRRNTQMRGQSAARSARRTYGAQAQAERNLAANLPKNVAQRGLVRDQLMAGAAQTAKFGEGLAHLAQRGARADVREINQGIRDARFDLRQTEQAAEEDTLASLVADRKEREQERAKDQQEARVEITEATKEAKRLIRNIPISALPALDSPASRDELAKDIAKMEGIGLVAARKAVRRLYEEMKPALGRLEGRTPTELGQTTMTGTQLTDAIRPGR